MTFVQARLDRSASDFLDVVWPAVAAYFGPGRLEAVEGDDHMVCRLLDRRSGVDYLFEPSGHDDVIPIASRVSETDFETITLTPAQHRRLERSRVPVPGRLAPAFFVHAYVQRLPAAQLRHVLLARADDVATALTSAIHHVGSYGDFWAIPAATIPNVRRLPDPLVGPYL